MVSTTPSEFSAMARRLASQCHTLGLKVPGFRSPPKNPGVTRALKRFPDGNVIVSVLLRGRHRNEVLNDMIDAVMLVNGLRSGRAEKMRSLLQWKVSSHMFDAA